MTNLFSQPTLASASDPLLWLLLTVIFSLIVGIVVVRRRNASRRLAEREALWDVLLLVSDLETILLMSSWSNERCLKYVALELSMLQQFKEETGNMTSSASALLKCLEKESVSTLPTPRRNSGRKATSKSSPQKKRKQSKTKPLPATKVS